MGNHAKPLRKRAYGPAMDSREYRAKYLIDKSVTTNCKAEDELLPEVLDNSKS